MLAGKQRDGMTEGKQDEDEDEVWVRRARAATSGDLDAVGAPFVRSRSLNRNSAAWRQAPGKPNGLLAGQTLQVIVCPPSPPLTLSPASSCSCAPRRPLCSGRVFEPMLFYMRVFGLFHDRSALARVYSVLVCAVLWANVTRFFWCYSSSERFGNKLFFKLLTHVWYFQCAFGHLVCARAAWTGQWGELLERIDSYMSRNATPAGRRYVCRLGMAFVALSALLILLDVAGMYYALLTPSPIDPILLVPFADQSYLSYVKVVYAFLYFYLSSCWVLPASYVMLVSECLRNNFAQALAVFKAGIQGAKAHELSRAFDRYRNKHNAVSKLVKSGDEMFRWFIANVMVTNMTLICCLGYNLPHLSHNQENQLLGSELTLYWLCFCSLQLFSIVITVSWLNQDACCLPDDPICYLLHESSVTFTPTQALQVNSFLMRISNFRVGFTSGNIFYISRTTPITMVAVLISYIVMLIKLGSSYDQSHQAASSDDMAGLNFTTASIY